MSIRRAMMFGTGFCAGICLLVVPPMWRLIPVRDFRAPNLPAEPRVDSPHADDRALPSLMPVQQFREGLTNNYLVSWTGKLTWSRTMPGSVRGVAFSAGDIYIATESKNGVAAVDGTTGAVRWFSQTPSWVHGDPVLTTDLVIVTYGHVPMDDPVGGVIAFARTTGEERWRVRFPAGIMPAPALRGDTIFVLAGDGCTAALSAANGKTFWHHCFSSPFAMSSPRLFGDALFGGGAEGSIYKWNTNTGDAIWRFRDTAVPRVGDVPVAISDSMVITTGVRPVRGKTSLGELPFPRIVAASMELLGEGRIRPALGIRFTEHFALAVRVSDGHELWRTSLGVGMTVLRNTSGTPVIIGDALYVASPMMRSLFRLNAQNGTIVWRQRIRAVARGAVTVVNQRVYLTAEDSTLRAFDARTGDPLGECRLTDSGTPFAPIVVGESLFMGDRSGRATMVPMSELDDTMRHQPAGPCTTTKE